MRGRAKLNQINPQEKNRIKWPYILKIQSYLCFRGSIRKSETIYCQHSIFLQLSLLH